MIIRGTAHAKYSLKYHVILTTKYRKKILTGALADDVKAVIENIATRDGYVLDEIGIDQDHVHFIIETKPRISPSQFIMNIKQETTYSLWQKFPVFLKKEYWKTRLFWSPSYFITTVGQVDEEIVKSYVANQGKVKKPCIR